MIGGADPIGAVSQFSSCSGATIETGADGACITARRTGFPEETVQQGIWLGAACTCAPWPCAFIIGQSAPQFAIVEAEDEHCANAKRPLERNRITKAQATNLRMLVTNLFWCV